MKIEECSNNQNGGVQNHTMIQFHGESEPPLIVSLIGLKHSYVNMAGKPGFNGLTPSEWTVLSRSIFDSKDVSSPREDFHKEHGATFSVALAESCLLYTSPSPRDSV